MKLEIIPTKAGANAGLLPSGEVEVRFRLICAPSQWDRFARDVDAAHGETNTLDHDAFMRAFCTFVGQSDAFEKRPGVLVDVVSDNDFKHLFGKRTM